MAVVGQIIDDKYEILKLIGKGGMSRVYLAMDKRLNKQWAIKEIEKNARDKNNEVVIQSAIAEANLIKQLDHPAIVRIVDIIDNGDVIYIIEDYIEGETLGTILEDNGAQPQELVIEWAMQICEALEYLHTRKPPIIYRDMKPANVMLKPDGNIKVIDFGIAREYKNQSLADTVSLGTKGYAAPEQFGGKGQTDARTDVYCLGVTLYHLLTGQNPCEPPYEIYPIRYWNPQLSAGLEAIIQKCTQLNPDDRYQSCAELLYALRHYEEYGAAYRARQRRKLNMFIAAVATSVFFLLVGIFSMIMRTQTNNADYAQVILQAEKAITIEDKLGFYADAVDIKAEDMEAYLGMVEAIKEDANFTTEEEQTFKQIINPHLSTLKEQDGYTELAFEIGKLYWYYYSYGETENSDNLLTRMTSAIPWFSDATEDTAAEFYSMSAVYHEIGTFHRDITMKIAEAEDDDETYKTYWDNLQKFVDEIANSDDEAEIVKQELCELTISSIESYTRKFKRAGITQDDMNTLVDKTGEVIASVDTEVSDEIKEAIETLTKRLKDTKNAIENAYRE